MIDCNKCENRGKNKRTGPRIFCESCVHSGKTWKKTIIRAKKTHLERIADLPDVFMLASLVQFKHTNNQRAKRY